MRVNFCIPVLAFCMCLTAPSASHAEVLTLKQSIERALTQNPDISFANEQKNAQKEKVAFERSRYFPKVDAVVKSGWERTDDSSSRTRVGRADGRRSVDYWRSSLELNVNQQIYDGNRTCNRVLAEENKLTSNRYAQKEIAEKVALNVAEVYTNMQSSQKILELAFKNYALYTLFFNQMTERFKQKVGTQGDVEQARSRMRRAEERIYIAQKDLRLMQERFQRVVGEAFPEKTRLEIAFTPPQPTELFGAIDIAKQSNFNILAIKAELEASKARLEGAKSEFLPEFDLDLSAQRRENVGGVKGPDNFAQALVSMRYNLYNGGADMARKREYTARKAASEERLRQTTMDVENTLSRYFHEYNLAKSRYALLKEQEKATSTVVEIYKEEFRVGRRTLLDVLDSENELYLIRTDLVRVESQLFLNATRILYMQGALLENLGLPYSAV